MVFIVKSWSHLKSSRLTLSVFSTQDVARIFALASGLHSSGCKVLAYSAAIMLKEAIPSDVVLERNCLSQRSLDLDYSFHFTATGRGSALKLSSDL